MSVGMITVVIPVISTLGVIWLVALFGI